MKSLNFWAFALIPWILEIVFGTKVFNTLLGSTLWALLLLLILIRAQARDQRLRTGLLRSSWLVTAVWIGLWILSYTETPGAHFGAGLPDLESKFWIHLHVAFLTTGLASVLTLSVAACLWILQQSRIRSDSWNRRGEGLKLPSLESLSRISHLSARLALLFWTAGSLLAVLTLFAARHPAGGFVSLLGDEQLLGVAFFWVLLLLNLLVARKLGKDRASQSYLAFSLVFLVAFVVWTLTKESTFHSPLRWLVP